MPATKEDETAWQSISRRKLAAQHEALNTPRIISVKVPAHLLPIDPPLAPHGRQPVHEIPAVILSTQDSYITSLPIPVLLSNLRDGTLTARAVTTAYILRASLAHQLTNCLTEPLFERALDQASHLDKHFKSSSSNEQRTIGPLHGLPVSVKDSFNIAGYDSSIGIASLCFKPSTSSAPLVEILESLGCIIIAKTNVPQTLASLDTVNNVFGRTYNPYNRLLTAGGSSGGEGVLVAMKGCAVGFGTDIGGSIRIPAMCNGVYGFKPSVGKVPYGGQRMTVPDGMSRASILAVAGPIARSVEDLRLVMREVQKVSWMFGADCVTNAEVPRGLPDEDKSWKGRGSGPNGEFVIGVLRCDGNCQLLPPVRNLIDEVADKLRSHRDSKVKIKVVDIPTPNAWKKSQSVMSKIMGVDGGVEMSKMLLATDEPLVPWMATRFKHGGKPAPLTRVAELQAQRGQLEREMTRDVWMYGCTPDQWGRRQRTVDALICPVASHPVPEIERWNAVGYTSSWVLFDYPAGTVPVREVEERDLELGRKLDERLENLGSWDVKSRELWDESLTDRRVYLGGMLSVQVVTGRLEDDKLGFVMGLVDEVVREKRDGEEKGAGGRDSKL